MPARRMSTITLTRPTQRTVDKPVTHASAAGA